MNTWKTDLPKIYRRNPETGEWNSLIGELVFCITDELKHFSKNKIYKITDKKSKGIKLEGFPGYYSSSNFEFLENKPALFREYRINGILDEKTITTEIRKERKINIIAHKNKILTRILINIINTHLGSSYDDLIKKSIRNYGTYQLIEEDFEEISKLTIKELINNYNNI